MKATNKDTSRMRRPEVREILRRDEAEVEFELKLQHREDCFRMTLPVLTVEEYASPPTWLDCYFLTAPRLFIVDLPDLEGSSA